MSDDEKVTPLPKSTHRGFYKDSDGSFGIRFGSLEELVEEAEEMNAKEVAANRKQIKVVPPPDNVA